MFHHPAWLRLLAARYRYDFAASCVVDDDGRVVAGLPWARIESRLTGRRLVALPFSDACQPLTDGASEEELARAVDEHRREAGLGLEVRWRLDSLSDGVAVHSYWRHTLPLEPDADAVAKRAKSSIRRGVVEGAPRGAHVRASNGRGGARRVLPAPPADAQAPGRARHSRSGSSTGSCRCSSAGTGSSRSSSDGDQPIAAAVFLQLRGHLIYKYGASDRAALERRPNNLLFAEVIRWALRVGLPRARLRPHRPRSGGAEAVQARVGRRRARRCTTPTPGWRPPSGDGSRVQRLPRL